jgi:hypothetical protein
VWAAEPLTPSTVLSFAIQGRAAHPEPEALDSWKESPARCHATDLSIHSRKSCKSLLIGLPHSGTG